MNTLACSRFLDLPALSALEHLRFVPRRRIEGSFSGRHSSRRLGGAGEFADFREYAEGEDLRHLDWKVLARTGRAYTRLYQDETNLVCTLAIDASGSMQFGAPLTKLAYVQYLATALSHVISRQQDQVGLAVIGARLETALAPAGTAGHVAHLQTVVERLTAAPATALADALRDLFQQSKRRGVLILMSDFLVDDLEAVFGSIRLFRSRAWEVITLHLVHPDEETLPEGAAFRFVGMENEGRVDCTPAEIRAAYQQRFEAHSGMVRNLALATGCDHRRVSTALPYLQTLSGFLVERAG